MEAGDVSTTLVEGYVKLLGNLSPDNKLDIISKLTLSVKSDIVNEKSAFYQAFGAWFSEESAEEIIKELRNARLFNRQSEEF